MERLRIGKGSLAVLTATVIALGSYALLRQKREGDFKAFFAVLREQAYDHYNHQLKPTDENYLKLTGSSYRLQELQQKLGIGHVGIYLQQHGIFYINYDNGPVKTYYAGRILKEWKETINGKQAEFYLTESEADDFNGIKTFQEVRDGVEEEKTYTIGERKIVNIDVAAFREGCRSYEKDWDKILQNDAYLRDGDARWRPQFQALSDAFRGVPRSEFVKRCTQAQTESAIDHEREHALFGADEFRAYAKCLTTSPEAFGLILADLELLLVLKNPNLSAMPYLEVAKQLIRELEERSGATSKSDFYRRFTNAQRWEASKELYALKYSGRKE